MVGNSSTNNNLTVSLFEIVIQCRRPPPRNECRHAFAQHQGRTLSGS